MTLKMAVFAPMPRPSVSTNATANPGTRARFRNAMRMSLIMGRLELDDFAFAEGSNRARCERP